MPASFILQRIVSNRPFARSAGRMRSIALTNVRRLPCVRDAEQPWLAALTDEAIAAKAMSICDPRRSAWGRRIQDRNGGPMVRRALARAATGAANR